MTITNDRGRRAFTDEQAAQIRQMYAGGMSQAAIARAFRVNSQTIGRLLRGDTYINGAGMQDTRATVAGKFRQPDLNAPDASMVLAQRIMAAQPDPGVLKMFGVKPEGEPVSPIEPTSPELARSMFRFTDRWPEGYTPTEEDWVAVGQPPEVGDSENQLAPPSQGE